MLMVQILNFSRYETLMGQTKLSLGNIKTVSTMDLSMLMQMNFYQLFIVLQFRHLVPVGCILITLKKTISNPVSQRLISLLSLNLKKFLFQLHFTLEECMPDPAGQIIPWEHLPLEPRVVSPLIKQEIKLSRIMTTLLLILISQKIF